MTASPAAAPDGTLVPLSDRPATRARVTRRGVVVAAGALILLALLVAMILAQGRPTGFLDPEDTGRFGAEALVEVLRDHGVDVEVRRGARAVAEAPPGPGTTVVVGDPELLGAGAAQLVARATRDADRIVLLSPTASEASAFDLPVTPTPSGAGVVPARCDGPIAHADDTVSTVDTRFIPAGAQVPAEVQQCFPLPGPDGDPGVDPGPGAPHGSAMVLVPASGSHPEIVAIGFSTGLVNGMVTEHSHAALGLRALGPSPRLIWYQPETADLTVTSTGATGAAEDPWPAWEGPAIALVLSAVLLLALVRGRRFGRLVPESLPVVVRAVETTEARAMMYRRARDRERSSAVLRDATIRRLRRRLALAPTAPPEAVVPVVAAATGIPTDDVGRALFGPAPSDDPGLLALGQWLADLEERARHP